MVIIANPGSAPRILQATVGNSPALSGIQVRIEDLTNVMGEFRVTRTLPGLIGAEDDVQQVIDICPVRLSQWSLKCWAILWLSKASSFSDILTLTTEGLIDLKTGELEGDEQRKLHIKDIDSAIADLVWCGLVSVERIKVDKLAVKDGETQKAVREILERREKTAVEIAIQKARLLYQLEQLAGLPQHPPAAKLIKHKTAAPAEPPAETTEPPAGE